MVTKTKDRDEWIRRELREPLLLSAQRYPIVTVLGPRQSGKTTLVRSAFPDHTYCNMEDPELRALATADPKEFLHRHRPPMILDEVQRVPEILSLLQVNYGAGPRSLPAGNSNSRADEPRPPSR